MRARQFRHKQILTYILELGYIPKESELSAKFNVSERTIRSDLEAILEKVPEVAVDDVRRMLMLRLRKRVPEMKDRDLLKLAEFFLSKKTEVKGHVDTTIIVEGWGFSEPPKTTD